MQLLETFYVHADRNFRTMMESPIEEGTTMTICGDTHGQWEDFCTIMDMNGLPSESNRVCSRRSCVRGAVVGSGSHWLFPLGCRCCSTCTMVTSWTADLAAWRSRCCCLPSTLPTPSA